MKFRLESPPSNEPATGYKRNTEHLLIKEDSIEFGPLEQKLWDVAEFIDIDINDSSNSYHRDILQSLLMPNKEVRSSLISLIIEEQENIPPSELRSIHVESFSFADIDLDLGTKRYVDKITIRFEGRPDIVMTASIDKERSENTEQSPSMNETNILKDIKERATSGSLQRWYGTTVIEDDKGLRTVICKEYLPGVMLENLTADFEQTLLEFSDEEIASIAFATGEMVGNAKRTLGGVPGDSHPMNIIINQEEDGQITARYCDVERVVKEPQMIDREIDIMRKKFGKFFADFNRGLEQ